MAIVLSRSTTTASKGQGTSVSANSNTSSSTNSQTTTSPRSDRGETLKPSSFQIQFTLRFLHSTPVTPEGETEPDPACP